LNWREWNLSEEENVSGFEGIQQLAEYVALSGDTIEDRMLELALDKLMSREASRLAAQRKRL